MRDVPQFVPAPRPAARAMSKMLTIYEEDGAREWKIAQYDCEPLYSHVVEIAKSGRARCRKCVAVASFVVSSKTNKMTTRDASSSSSAAAAA
jgi:hypothetical protein